MLKICVAINKESEIFVDYMAVMLHLFGVMIYKKY